MVLLLGSIKADVLNGLVFSGSDFIRVVFHDGGRMNFVLRSQVKIECCVDLLPKRFYEHTLLDQLGVHLDTLHLFCSNRQC